MKRIFVLAIVIAAAYAWNADPLRLAASRGVSAEQGTGADAVLANAFAQQRNDVQVQGSGRVTRILSDDNEGSRHQRFIVQLDSGQTLLVAHNIDLAERLASLKAGDQVEFNGEYEWNSQGGVIHWTHHDPEGRHEAGWIRHNGRTYQ